MFSFDKKTKTPAQHASATALPSDWRVDDCGGGKKMFHPTIRCISMFSSFLVAHV
jgi:rubredoxin